MVWLVFFLVVFEMLVWWFFGCLMGGLVEGLGLLVTFTSYIGIEVGSWGNMVWWVVQEVC